jgi:Protein of unknown function (DUF3379)
MNCLEFHRAVGADPRAQTAELLEHARQCTACARYRDELQRMDELISRALKIEIDPQSARAPTQRRWLPRWAAAASVAAACVLAGLLWLSAPRATFAEQLIAHVEGERQSLVRTNEPVEPGALDKVLARSGVRLKPGAGMISYARSCWFRGQFVPHLVVQSDEGPVTVLLLTRETGVKRREAFSEGGFHGVVLPAPRGAIAVLAQEKQAEQVAERFLQAVEY